MAGDRADRQKGRIGGATLLAQRRQHHRHDLVEPLQHAQQHVIEPAGTILLGRAHELVVEAEAVQERPQPRVVVRAETVVRAERIAHLRQRQVQILLEHLGVRHAVRHLAQPVHVVAERHQPRRPVIAGQGAEGIAHHRRARHLAERAHMRQTGRAVAGLQQHRLPQRLERRQRLVRLARVDQQLGRDAVRVRQPLLQHVVQQVAGLFERPGSGVAREGFEVLQHGGRFDACARRGQRRVRSSAASAAASSSRSSSRSGRSGC